MIGARAAALLIALVVSGCVSGNAPPAPDPAPSLLRNPTAPVGSQVDVTVGEVQGVWHLRWSAGHWPVTDQVTFQAHGEGIAVTSGFCAECAGPVLYRLDRPGRFVRSGPIQGATPAMPQEIWIYWADFDRRTMAIGNPNGDFVAIMDRSPHGGTDRIVAARDILKWYGYDS